MPYGAPSRPSSTHVTARGPHPQPASGRRLLAVGGHQTAHPVRGLRALANPIIDARQIELELLLAAAGNGVEEPHVLRSEEHTSELQSRLHLVCRLLLENKHADVTHCSERTLRNDGAQSQFVP